MGLTLSLQLQVDGGDQAGLTGSFDDIWVLFHWLVPLVPRVEEQGSQWNAAEQNQKADKLSGLCVTGQTGVATTYLSRYDRTPKMGWALLPYLQRGCPKSPTLRLADLPPLHAGKQAPEYQTILEYSIYLSKTRLYSLYRLANRLMMLKSDIPANSLSQLWIFQILTQATGNVIFTVWVLLA